MQRVQAKKQARPVARSTGKQSASRDVRTPPAPPSKGGELHASGDAAAGASEGRSAPAEVTDALDGLIDDFHSEREALFAADAKERNAQKKAKKNQGVLEGAPRSPDAATLPAGARYIETKDIRVDQIVIRTGNPRQEFTEKELDELGESILAVGQIEAASVRLLPNGEGYELFAGERRWRACQRKQIPTLRCAVFELDDVALVEMRGAENFFRQDFNPMEEAIWFDQMLKSGFNQTQLAKKLGISQGEVSHTVSLLKLPEFWQREIITGDITASDGRFIVPWLHITGFSDELAKAYKYTKKHGHRFDTEHRVKQTLNEMSRPLVDSSYADPGTYRYRQVNLKPTAEELKELDVHDVKLWDKKSEQRAFNIPLWTKLEKASAAKRQAAESKKSEKQADKCGMSQKEKDDQFAKRLWQYLINWKHGAILDQIADAPTSLHLRLALFFAVRNGAFRRGDGLREAVASVGGKGCPYGEEFESLALIKPDKIGDLVKAAVCRWVGASPWQSDDVDHNLIEELATELKVNVATDWRVDEAFLNLHTLDQLGELCREWKLPTVLQPSKKGELVKWILQKDSTLEPALPTPKELKGCKRP